MRNNKEYYNNNIEKNKQYYQENKQIILKREHLYYQKNQAEIRIIRNYYLSSFFSACFALRFAFIISLFFS